MPTANLSRAMTSVCESGSVCRNGFRVGGIGVELLGECQDVALIPSLAPFQTHASAGDIQIRVEWVSELLPMSGAKLFDSGSVWRLYEEESCYRFDFTAARLGASPYKRLLIDRGFGTANLLMNREAFEVSTEVAIAPLDYPLDELLIMHRLTRDRGIELHACGVMNHDGTGNLFVGHSGAGKSTTARLWMKTRDIEILSDDRIIVRAEDRRPNSDGRSPGFRMYGTPWHGESQYASPHSAELSAVFILEHGQGNRLTRLTPSQATGELFARSFVPFHRNEYVESALNFLEDVVAAVPVYRYQFEPDEQAVEAILNFHD